MLSSNFECTGSGTQRVPATTNDDDLLENDEVKD